MDWLRRLLGGGGARDDREVSTDLAPVRDIPPAFAWACA